VPVRPEAKRGATAATARPAKQGNEVNDSTQRQREPLARLADAGPGAGPAAEKGREAARRPEPLSVCVERAVEAYFDDLDGERATDLYALVLDEVEAPLLRSVMRRTDGNQSRAAEMLGLSRGTLRKKLKQHGLL
jgi:Factor for inversion stimulation Fis, transcriptional activator